MNTSIGNIFYTLIEFLVIQHKIGYDTFYRLDVVWWLTCTESTNVLYKWRNRWHLHDPMGFYTWYNSYTPWYLGIGRLCEYQPGDRRLCCVSVFWHQWKLFQHWGGELSTSGRIICWVEVKTLFLISQVVDGSEYQFDIVLKGKPVNRFWLPCKKGMGHGDRCQAVVYDVPWENKREIKWNLTTCSRKTQPPEQGKHTLQSEALSLVETLCSD